MILSLSDCDINDTRAALRRDAGATRLRGGVYTQPQAMRIVSSRPLVPRQAPKIASCGRHRRLRAAGPARPPPAYA